MTRVRPKLLGPPSRSLPHGLYITRAGNRQLAPAPIQTRERRHQRGPDDAWTLPPTTNQIRQLRENANRNDTLYLPPASKGEAQAMLTADSRAERDRDRFRERAANE